MKRLGEILKHVKHQLIGGNFELPVKRITFNSQDVNAGDLFVAVRGTRIDGHQFIEQAINSGAVSIVCEELPGREYPGTVFVKVENSRFALSAMAAAWYGFPANDLKIVGVTGTNGKTTVATMLYSVFEDLGYPSGLFSTVKILINRKEAGATHTTPDPLAIHQYMGMMRDAGCEYCFMEVSSHAVDQHRVAHIPFAGGVFTNITQDHLDYHDTFDNYIKTKKRFFDDLNKEAFAIYNADDKNGRVMVQNCPARVYSYATKRPADYKAKVIEKQMGGMKLELNNAELWTPLTGLFNAYNLAATYAAAVQLHPSHQEVLTAVSKQKPVRGRFEVVRSGSGISGIIDYAHTPDAVINVLKTISEIRTGNEQLITVIGAGGDRDASKRPLMAGAACQLSDTVIFTSDNPRTEDPGSIIQDMEKGIPPAFHGQALVIGERGSAIQTACMIAQPGDIILVAGKGHETYQEINGVRHHFDDREILLKYLK